MTYEGRLHKIPDTLITRASGPCVFSSDEEVIALANEILSKRRKVFEELAK